MGLLNKFRKGSQRLTLEQEVADHLTSLFNTKESYGSWQKGLGLPCYSSGKSRSLLVNEMKADIQSLIEAYEKRIKLLEIKEVSDTNLFRVKFQLSCLIGIKFHSFYIGFAPTQRIIDVEAI